MLIKQSNMYKNVSCSVIICQSIFNARFRLYCILNGFISYMNINLQVFFVCNIIKARI